jgi:hypothetical protein
MRAADTGWGRGSPCSHYVAGPPPAPAPCSLGDQTIEDDLLWPWTRRSAMRRRHEGWSALLAAGSMELAGFGTLVLGRGPGSSFSVSPCAGLRPSSLPSPALPAASRPDLSVVTADRGTAEFRAAAIGGHGRHHGHHGLAAAMDGRRVQQARDPGPRFGIRRVAHSDDGEPAHSLVLPVWRALLESRWQQRLGVVTKLSLAYHDIAERLRSGHGTGHRIGARHLRRLMRAVVAARRALCDTEEALARLSAGNYGRCEQCAAAIPATWLGLEPEARYCGRCWEAQEIQAARRRQRQCSRKWSDLRPGLSAAGCEAAGKDER